MIFSNGLPVGTGLKIQHPTPVDDRLHVSTFADLASLPYKYNGLSCRVADEDNKLYVYHLSTNTWSAEDIAATETIAVISTLNSRSLNVITQQSITADTSGVKFVNDTSSPGNNKVYGTDGSGVRGWRNLSLQHFEESTSVFSSTTFNRWEAVGASANIPLVLSPKGIGSISLQVPDGTNLGGNIRGNNAVDLQRTRSVNTQVASGNDSFVATANSTASGTRSAAFCQGNASGGDAFSAGSTAAGNFSFSANRQNSALASESAVFGISSIASSTATASFCIGAFGRTEWPNTFAIGGGQPNSLNSSKKTYFTSIITPATAGTPYTLTPTSITLPTGGSTRAVTFIRLTYTVSLNTNNEIWTREVILSIARATGNIWTVLNTDVRHNYVTASLAGATLVENLTAGGNLSVVFTPSTNGNHAVQVFIESFGAAPSNV
jgi:hypothetical protein